MKILSLCQVPGATPGLLAALLTFSSGIAACGSDLEAPDGKRSGQQPSGADDDKGGDDSSKDDDDSSDEKAPARDAGKDSDRGDAGSEPKSPDDGDDTAAKGDLPCDVAQVLETHCAECHGDPPNWGSPMSLVEHADFHTKGATTKTKSVDVLVEERINDKSNPMPPKTAKPMPDADRAILEAWLSDGAPKAKDGCAVRTPDPDATDDDGDKPKHPDATCYELRNHGKPVSGDTSKYQVAPGEHYAEFFFDAPWKEESVMVSFRTLADDSKLLHHWLMYKSNGREADGEISSGVGSHIGASVELLAGWALGGSDNALPEGVAAAMPPPGGKLMIEWHYYNQTNAMAEDSSGVEVCVIPKKNVDPANVSSLTWVGNENLGTVSLFGVIGLGGMPPQQESTVQDICTPTFKGLPAGEPVRIFSFTPHMHKLGRHMRTWIARKDGTVEKVFDEEFQFDHQISYDVKPMLELWPGDRIVNECTFFNDTSAPVGFGPSSDQEMCYQFTYSYPAGALVNGVSSLTGSTNTCWDNNPAEAARLIAKAK